MHTYIYIYIYIYIYVTVRLSNQGFGQIPKAFSDLAKSLFHSGIWPNP